MLTVQISSSPLVVLGAAGTVTFQLALVKVNILKKRRLRPRLIVYLKGKRREILFVVAGSPEFVGTKVCLFLVLISR